MAEGGRCYASPLFADLGNVHTTVIRTKQFTGENKMITITFIVTLFDPPQSVIDALRFLLGALMRILPCNSMTVEEKEGALDEQET